MIDVLLVLLVILIIPQPQLERGKEAVLDIGESVPGLLASASSLASSVNNGIEKRRSRGG